LAQRILELCIAATASALLTAGASVAPAAQVPAHWLGGSGNWNDPTKWSTGVAPNNGADTYTVNIDNGNPAASVVQLWPAGNVQQSYEVDALTIDASDKLYMRHATLKTAALTVNGDVELNTNTGIELPENATVSGGGTVTFSDATSLRVAGGTMTIDSGVTVHGGDGAEYYGHFPEQARLGAIETTLVNRGHIHADTPFRMIVLAGNIDNQGTIEVSNGGVIAIDSDFSLNTIGNLVNNGGSIVIAKTLHNSGQTLNVTNSQGWVLRGTINGGFVQMTGGRSLYVPAYANGLLSNLTLNGNVEVSGSLGLSNVSGSGTIKVISTLEGGAVVATSVLPAGFTVRGGKPMSPYPDPFEDPFKGAVFVGTNYGTIRAEPNPSFGSGPQRLRLRNTTAVVNAGTLEVCQGGTLTSDADLTFVDDAKLVIDGGGRLEVNGDLNLLSDFDSLEVRPKAGGGAYDNYLIVTATGFIFPNQFSQVTPGITVTHTTTQIRISGTPVPEPSAAGLLMGMLTLAGRRRRRAR
jgi:hypothetical protein